VIARTSARVRAAAGQLRARRPLARSPRTSTSATSLNPSHAVCSKVETAVQTGSAPASAHQPAWPVAKKEDSRLRPSLRSRTLIKGLRGQLDLVDPYFGELLTMTDELADPLLGLVLEDQNLLVFGLADDRAAD
jgi:hypothetical protein